ncbi:aldo/keto reductase [Pseudactinotalea terrae]|uniref:aldo/keto reductase n=1 Tax=Pseudactinotalea terrae TaxID=1743262 RepID=UPI0012E0D56B|nr:aldo/keto reductase [Pseudactinotalea terrae]
MAFRPVLRPVADPGFPSCYGLGCAPIGNLYTSVAEADAEETVAAALAAGIRFFDTAPHYGAGLSEQRLGRALDGVPRDDLVIATKVGRAVVDDDGRVVETGRLGSGTVFDGSRDGVLRSLEGSLRRLRTDRVDLLYLHDPPDVDEALGSTIPALRDLLDQGVVRAIGVGMVWTEPLTRFVREAPIDVVMEAGRLTLLDRRADEALLPAARDLGVGVVAAGVLNSGVLADPVGSPYFDYYPASAEIVARAEAMQQLCARYGVELRHAAARYPLQRQGVEAVVVGARTAAEVHDWVAGLEVAIPAELWRLLDEAA